MNIFQTIASTPIKFYRRYISPLFSSSCRFSPTCSSYALQAIEKHGAVKGLILSAWRILRCNPWHKGPCQDHVPERFDWRQMIGYKRGILKKDSCKN